MDKQSARLMAAMIHYDKGDTKRIQHLIKVHDLCLTIGVLEGLDEPTLHILETTAILHDIGTHLSEQKYGMSLGKYQELEGPPEAEKLMRDIGGYSDDVIERVKYLIGHHHTYTDIQGMDYQILIEADFLVNLYESPQKYGDPEKARVRFFKTQTGNQLLLDMFKSRSA